MAKKLEPPTKEQMIDYARQRNLNVDADWLWEYWNEGEWVKANGQPVRNWKQTMLTHHKFNEEKPIKYSCKICRKSPAPYISGSDRDGHPYHFCHLHKPKPKINPKIKELAQNLLHSPLEEKTSSNEQVRKLLGRL